MEEFKRDKRNTYQCSLAHKVNGIKFNHWFKQSDCLTQSGASAGDAQCHCRTVTNMWIVRFSQQRYHRWTLFRCSEITLNHGKKAKILNYTVNNHRNTFDNRRNKIATQFWYVYNATHNTEISAMYVNDTASCVCLYVCVVHSTFWND